MAKAITRFDTLLKDCKTMREIFECQTALADGLSDYEVQELRAKYAGLTMLEAECYQNALNTVKAIEAKSVAKQLEKVTDAVCNFACR